MYRDRRRSAPRSGDVTPDRANRGDFLLQVKGNQPTLLRLTERLGWSNTAAFTTSDRGHGRHEVRSARVVRIHGAGIDRGQRPWPGATMAVRIDRHRTDRSGTTTETAYVITSRNPTNDGTDTQFLARSCRAHWAIENQLHWICDAVYGEDDAPRHIANIPVICAACFSIAIAVARRLGMAHADARHQFKHDRRLVGALLGVRLV